MASTMSNLVRFIRHHIITVDLFAIALTLKRIRIITLSGLLILARSHIIKVNDVKEADSL